MKCTLTCKHDIECAKWLLKQDKLDVVSRDTARTLVQWLSHDQEHVDEDNDQDDKLDGDDAVLVEIGEDSESEEFGDEDNADYDDNDDDVIIVMVTFCDGEDEGDDDDGDDDDGDDDDGADTGDVEVDIWDVLHVIKSRRTCRTWKGKGLFYRHDCSETCL